MSDGDGPINIRSSFVTAINASVTSDDKIKFVGIELETRIIRGRLNAAKFEVVRQQELSFFASTDYG